MKQTLGFKYNPYEDRILKTLIFAHRELTTRQISEFSGISYSTAKRYLDLLKKSKKVQNFVLTNRIYWKI